MDEFDTLIRVTKPQGANVKNSQASECNEHSSSRALMVVATQPRSGFTLFEVAISLVIVAFGIVSVLMLIPSGIKAQQLARFQVLASIRAMELIDAFSAVNGGHQYIHREGPFPWDVQTSYRAYSHDLETATGTNRYGLMPLPTDIAKRLDSDGDEIQRILGEGGYVYYSNPIAVSSLNQLAAMKNIPLPNESGKIICAVSGYAQQNAIPAFSYKDWPYYAPYPSPPMHLQVGSRELKTSLPMAPYSVIAFGGDPNTNLSNPVNIMLWENTLEADRGEIGVVFRSVVKGPDLPHTTRWVDACASGGSLQSAKIANQQFYPRESGYLACCDQYGWIPEPFLLNPPGWYRNSPPPSVWRINAPPTPDPPGQVYTGRWEWRSYGPDTAKIFPYSRIAGDATKDMPSEMLNLIQPATLPNYAGGPPVTNPVVGISSAVLAKESALAYFALARWYAREKGVSIAIQEGIPLNDDGNLLSQTALFSSGGSEQAAVAVNAARILAHAAMVLTGHLDTNNNGSFSLGECEIYREGAYPFSVSFSSNSSGTPTLPTSRPTLTRINTGIPGISQNTTPAFSGVDVAKIKVYVDNAAKLGMRFAATLPYDWGSPRPLNRAIMMDNPLLQYDMFEANKITPTAVTAPAFPFSLYNYGQRPASTRYGYSAPKAPAQWRIASAQPVVNIGRSQCFPSMDLTNLSSSIFTQQGAGRTDSAGNPNHQHFTLARPFQPAERTRELVFWAVDWQSYEDFETAPSAPVDASRHPKLAPYETSSTASNFGRLSGTSANPSALINDGSSYFYERWQPAARNPEKVISYLGPTTNVPTGDDRLYVAGVDQSTLSDNGARPDHPRYNAINTNNLPAGPALPPRNPAMVFSGQFGADRNASGENTIMLDSNPAQADWIKGFYGKLDRGPIPRSVRLRATLIARFNFYDPRIPLVAR